MVSIAHGRARHISPGLQEAPSMIAAGQKPVLYSNPVYQGPSFRRSFLHLDRIATLLSHLEAWFSAASSFAHLLPATSKRDL